MAVSNPGRVSSSGAVQTQISSVPFEIIEGEGTFEVAEDAALLDEIAALRESRPKGPAGDGE